MEEICRQCGAEKVAICPECLKEGKFRPVEVYSRVVGYLRPVSTWNDGKKQEYKERKEFKVEG